LAVSIIARLGAGGVVLIGALVAEAWVSYCASVLRKRLISIAPDVTKHVDAGANGKQKQVMMVK
jgi:hypothetical protein